VTLKILWKYQKIKEVVCNLGTQSLFQFKIYGGLSPNMGLKEDASINALCLQKKSTLSGAYDARIVCHKVVVPFEMDTLGKVLVVLMSHF